MGVKGDNLELISGLLLPSFILNCMAKRVKEKELNKEKSEKGKERENDRQKREMKRKAKVLGDILLDREFFGGGRLWFMLFRSETLNSE